MPENRVRTRHLAIERHARYALRGDLERTPAQLWFVLHGYGQLAPRFLSYFDAVDDGTRWIVAPEGLHRYYLDHAERKVGASWMTSEDRLTDIADYVAYLDRLHAAVLVEAQARAEAGAGAGANSPGGMPRATAGPDGGPPRVTALGFSQGVHTLCRWVAFGEARIDRAVLWGATTPPDLDLEAYGDRLRAVDLHLVVGEEDEYYGAGAVRAHEDRLEAHGIPFTAHAFAGGHRLDAELLRRLAAPGG